MQAPAESRSGNSDLTVSQDSPRELPSGASVLRRGLFIWGLGHIAIGDKRGWLLMALQPLVIVGLLLIAVQLIDGTRWIIVFLPLVAILAFWLAQAIHAYRRAVELGAKPGGEMQAAAFLPVAVAVLTVFWLVGGRHGSPAATLEAYAVALLTGKSDAAAHLYVSPTTKEAVEAAGPNSRITSSSESGRWRSSTAPRAASIRRSHTTTSGSVSHCPTAPVTKPSRSTSFAASVSRRCCSASCPRRARRA